VDLSFLKKYDRVKIRLVGENDLYVGKIISASHIVQIKYHGEYDTYYACYNLSGKRLTSESRSDLLGSWDIDYIEVIDQVEYNLLAG